MSPRIVEVAAGIWYRKKQFYLARRRGGALDGCWEFPGGKREDQESFRETLLREWKEELGCEPLNPRFWKETMTPVSSEVTIKMQSFVFYEITGFPELRDHSQADWFFLPELRTLKLAPADVDLLVYLTGIPLFS